MSKAGEHFCAKTFYDRLETEGDTVPCDDTRPGFYDLKIPDFYDEEKFSRGQKYYQKHLTSMLYANLVGVICFFSHNKSAKVLMHTNRSSTPQAAFKRYMATSMHINTWFTEDFKPGSKAFKSLIQVNRYHSTTNKICSKNGMEKDIITQFDMALAQFGFMGVALVRPERVGIYNPSKEDEEAYVHFWRIMSFSLGIDEKYSICRESVEETKLISEEMIKRTFLPNLEKPDENFNTLSRMLIRGMRVFIFLLQEDAFLSVINDIVPKEFDRKKNKSVKNLSFLLWIYYWFISLGIVILKIGVIRSAVNSLVRLAIWAQVNVPIFAYMAYGKEHSHFVPKCLR